MNIDLEDLILEDVGNITPFSAMRNYKDTLEKRILLEMEESKNKSNDI